MEEFKAFAAECVIRSGTRLIRFDKLFDCQIAIAMLAAEYRGIWLCKDRQLGLTEILICWMLCRAKRNPAYAGAAFSITEKDAIKLSKRVERMPSQISDFGWETDSVGVRKPMGGGELNFRPSTKHATRGLESIWDLFFDEAGFPQIIDEMYAASTPSQEMVGADARTFIVSTIPPEGRDAWFWKQGEENNPDGVDLEERLEVARQGKFINETKLEIPEIPGFCAWEDESGWVKVLIGHKAHPIYGANPNYVEDQRVKKKLTHDQVQREHNLGLPQKGGSLFDPRYIEQLPRCQWLKPIAGHSYLMGVDPNFGSIGNDYFVGGVWDITSLPFQHVATYRSNTHSAHHSEGECLKLMQSYRPVITSVEGNGGGVAIAEKLARALPSCRVELVRTSQTSKIIHTDRLAQLVEALELAIPDDAQILVEMRRFSALKREAIGGNDDCVMCAAIAFAWLDDALVARNKRDTSWLRAR